MTGASQIIQRQNGCMAGVYCIKRTILMFDKVAACNTDSADVITANDAYWGIIAVWYMIAVGCMTTTKTGQCMMC
jgi:hypothetical protein